MTILKDAYKNYLEKKYSNEIKEFQKVALKEIDGAISHIKILIVDEVLKSGTLQTNKLFDLKKDYERILKLKNRAENDTLQFEPREEFYKYNLLNVVEAYEKLHNVVLKGEE